MTRASMLAAVVGLALLSCRSADAQVVVVSGYAPAPVVTYRPVAPAVAYRPVAPVVAYSPVVAPVAAPATPVAVRSTFTATPVVHTRYRPILGGTVSRVRYHYTPTTVVTPLY
ncbi:hypothetical protein [Botrimarina sp.]|uniref:hypothetical protein n=1 Tax=Botrimarina sp. TaxID=2795802 RepID=UPI0032ED8493